MKKSIGKLVLFGAFFSVVLLCAFTGKKEAAADETLTIIANVTIKAEYKDDVLKAVKSVVEATRKEEGNIFYDVFEDVSNPLKITFIETWKSQKAIDSHNNSTHFKDFAKAIDGKSSLSVAIYKQKF